MHCFQPAEKEQVERDTRNRESGTPNAAAASMCQTPGFNPDLEAGSIELAHFPADVEVTLQGLNAL